MNQSDRIRLLEEQGRIIEEKIKRLTQVMDDITFELENMKTAKGKKQKRTKKEDKINDSVDEEKEKNTSKNEEKKTPVIRLDMVGSSFENICLGTGWYPPSEGFRWAGKDGKNPVIYFVVEPNRSYRLVAKLFVPEPLTKKLIKIIANEKEIDEMKAEKQRKMVKAIVIPADVIPTSRLKVEFMAGTWNPNEIDKNLESKTLSLAFDYIELYCLNE